MLDLQPNQQKINPSDDHVLQMVFRFRVLKLDVQAVLDPDVHFYGRVRFGREAVAVDPDFFLADHVSHAPRHQDSHVVAQLDVDPVVRLVLLLDVLEVELERLRVLQVARRGELLRQRQEVVRRAAVVVHFCLQKKARSKGQSLCQFEIGVCSVRGLRGAG